MKKIMRVLAVVFVVLLLCFGCRFLCENSEEFAARHPVLCNGLQPEPDPEPEPEPDFDDECRDDP